MKINVIGSIILTLLVSLAAPAGAVFAMEEGGGEVSIVELESELMDLPVVNSVMALDEESPETEQVLNEEVKAIEQTLSEVSVESQYVQEPAQEPVVVPPVAPLPVSPLLITAYKATGSHVHAIQLYNNTSSMLSLEGFTLVYVAGDEEYELPLVDGWIEPRSYMVLAWEGESDYADIEFRFDNSGGGILKLVELTHDAYQSVRVEAPSDYDGALLHRFKSTAGNYTTNVSFSASSPTVSGGGLYVLPEAPDLSVLEVLVNPRDCTYGETLDDCYDYIKIRNDSAYPLDLSLYRFRSGYANTNSTANNTTYFDAVLQTGEVRTLTHGSNGSRMNIAANDGTIWLEDVYGYVSYDLGVAPYVDSDLAAQSGRSWAYNEQTEQWQWATPSPHENVNNFTQPEPEVAATLERQLAPCRDGQYRSEETNRCRSIALGGDTLKPCREGQYRSEETNRCRSIASAAASVLKPCADDQFRNPETNRCKKIASSEDLADCGEGRERNPNTNRCRNVLAAAMPLAPFAAEPTVQQVQQSMLGWWMFGGLSLVAVAYAGWQWRFEAGRLVRQVRGRFSFSSKE